MCSPHLKSRKVSHLLRGQSMYINYLEFFCLGDLLLFYLFIYSIIYVRMDSWYLFYTWGYNLVIQNYFILLPNCSSFGHWTLFSVGFYVLLTYYYHCVFLIGFTLSDTMKMLQVIFIFPTQSQNKPFLLRVLVIFTGEWQQKSSKRCFVGLLLFLSPPSWQSKEIYVYPNPFIYPTSIDISVCNHLYWC